MKNLTAFIVLTLITLGAFAQSSKMKGEKDKNVIADQYIVVFSDEFQTPFTEHKNFQTLKTREQRAEALQSYRKTVEGKVGGFLKQMDISPEAVKNIIAGGFVGFTAKLNAGQLKALQANPIVKYIEWDRRVLIFKDFKPLKFNTQTTDWGVEYVGGGSSSGEGRYAFVLDTGIYGNHPDLNVDKSLSASFIASEPSFKDNHGHGTHCAGIIGAKDNNFGTKGVAAGATIIGVKVLDGSGSGTASTLLAGLAYTACIAFPGDVVNMSLSGAGFEWLVDFYIKTLLGSRGIYVTIAAGNNNANASGFWPASTNGTNIFTISNMTQAEEIAGSSNFGNGPVDYAAPGTSIYSTDIVANGSYSTRSGTSMAAPHVAGILLVNSGRIKSNGVLKVDKDATPDKIAVVK
ncbi:MAG: S8 family serine peptidase [Chitinophagales bacterium]